MTLTQPFLRNEDEVEGVLYPVAIPVPNYEATAGAEAYNQNDGSILFATQTIAAVERVDHNDTSSSSSNNNNNNSNNAPTLPQPIRTVDDIVRDEKNKTRRKLHQAAQFGRLQAQQERSRVTCENESTAKAKACLERQQTRRANEVAKYQNSLEESYAVPPPPPIGYSDNSNTKSTHFHNDKEEKVKSEGNNNSNNINKGNGYEISDYKISTDYGVNEYKMPEYKSMYDN